MPRRFGAGRSSLRLIAQDRGSDQIPHRLRGSQRLGSGNDPTGRSLRLADLRGIKAFWRDYPEATPTNNHIADYEGFYASVFYSYFAALG